MLSAYLPAFLEPLQQIHAVSLDHRQPIIPKRGDKRSEYHEMWLATFGGER